MTALNHDISLSNVLSLNGIQLKQGYNTCPVCNRPNKFKILDDKYYKCFHPSCAANKRGDVFNLLPLLGLSSSFKESLSIVGKLPTNDYTEESRRSYVFSKVFEVYKLLAEQHKAEILPILNGRGYYHALNCIEFGYSPDAESMPHLVFEKYKISEKELIKYGLLNTHGDFLASRIIFPIYTKRNKLVHFQGRSTIPDSDKRWLCTPSLSRYSSITNYLFNLNNVVDESAIIITEGISDCLSLLELNLKAVASFGLSPDLVSILYDLPNLKTVIAIYDNDRHPFGYNDMSDMYKSWFVILPKLIELQEARPDLVIWCITPPEKALISDVNDWLQQGLTRPIFESHCKAKIKSLEQFTLSLFSNQIKYHPWLLRLLNVHQRPTDLASFSQILNTNYVDITSYLLQLITEL